MTIELYQSGPGAEALTKCPVTQPDTGAILCFENGIWAWDDGTFPLHSREALAVIERGHRIALAGKGVWLELCLGRWYVRRSHGWWLTANRRWSSHAHEAAGWGDYAQAQIPAILATFGKASAQ